MLSGLNYKKFIGYGVQNGGSEPYEIKRKRLIKWTQKSTQHYPTISIIVGGSWLD